MDKFKDWFLEQTTDSRGYVNLKGKAIVSILFFIFICTNLIVISLADPIIKRWILAIMASLGAI